MRKKKRREKNKRKEELVGRFVDFGVSGEGIGNYERRSKVGAFVCL